MAAKAIFRFLFAFSYEKQRRSLSMALVFWQQCIFPEGLFPGKGLGYWIPKRQLTSLFPDQARDSASSMVRWFASQV
jgi:hypothetical protein